MGGKNGSRNCPIKYPKEKEINLKKLEEKKNTLATLGTNLFLSTEKIVKNYFQLLTEKGF